MAGGFRAAEAFVEVTADLREGPVILAARRAAEDVDRELTAGAERAGARMTDALGAAGGEAGKRWSRDARGRLHDERGRFVAEARSLGEGMGGDLGQGLMDLFGRKARVLANPTLMSILAPAAVAVSPFAGALIGAGLMAGIGTVAVGAGIAGALQDPEIKHAAATTGEDIKDILLGAAEPFKGELLDSLDQAERSFQAWEPWLRRIGKSSSQAVEPLTTGVTGLVTRMLPGLDRALAGMRPLWSSIRDGLVGIGDAAGDLFDGLSDNGAEFALAMRMGLQIVEGSIRVVGFLVNGLTEVFGFMIELMLKAGDLALEWGTKLSGLPGPIGEIGQGLRAVGEHVASGRPQWEEWKRSAQAATDGTAGSTAAMTERQRLLTQSMGATVREAGSLKAAFDLLTGAALTSREAESNYQAAIDNVTASIKANGKTLDLNTEKGRANDAAIRTLIGSISAKAQATYDETAATKGTAAAEAAATKVYEQGRAQLVKNLTQILGNAGAAEKLADEIMGIPKSWHTKTTADTKGATGAIKTYLDWLNSIPPAVYTRLVTETRSARGGHKEFSGMARGGEITGGSGVRDDVPVLAMAKEWVIRKSSVKALERMYGPGIMDALNNADGRGWKALPVRGGGGPHRKGVDGLSRPAMGPGAPGLGRESHVVHIGQVVLDASSVQSIQDVVELISGLTTSARSLKARTVAPAGR